MNTEPCARWRPDWHVEWFINAEDTGNIDALCFAISWFWGEIEHSKKGKMVIERKSMILKINDLEVLIIACMCVYAPLPPIKLNINRNKKDVNKVLLILKCKSLWIFTQFRLYIEVRRSSNLPNWPSMIYLVSSCVLISSDLQHMNEVWCIINETFCFIIKLPQQYFVPSQVWIYSAVLEQSH